ncbi:hypothetical protein Anas_00905, partial [Armadillidium nasatum]
AGSALLCDPWVSWVSLNLFLHVVWVTTLLCCQLYQILILAMTTNERMNCYRYRHFKVGKKGEIKSPFDRGIKQNCVNLLNWRCCGASCQPDSTDWLNAFSIEEHQEEDSQPLINDAAEMQGFV